MLGAMPRASLLLSLALLCLAASIGGGRVGAQDARVPDTLAGTWTRSVPAARARAIVLSAFEPRLTRFPEIMRPIARDRIATGLPMADRIDVALDGRRVRVTFTGERRVVIETPLGGSGRVRLEDGDERRVTQRLRGGWLEQELTNDDGTIQRLLSTEGDGRTMHVDYTVHNEQLGAPVRWRVDYGRR